MVWIVVGVVVWLVVAAGVALVLARFLARASAPSGEQFRGMSAEQFRDLTGIELGVAPARPAGARASAADRAAAAALRSLVSSPAWGGEPVRVLVVDDDAGVRVLLRATLELLGVVVEEADGEAAMRARLSPPPALVVLDIGLPGKDGLSLCRMLKQDPATAAVPVVLLSGLEAAEEHARAAGAVAFVHKPFNPLELSAMILNLIEAPRSRPAGESLPPGSVVELHRLFSVGLGRQGRLDAAYRQTVAVLAAALEAKDASTGRHAQRVVAYASELTLAVAPTLLDDPSLEYGFLLHDLGKIAIPDAILQKPARLTAHERRLVERHPLTGADLLAGVELLEGEGIRVVRSHHERWDGRGYPDRLARTAIPLGARIFAVADALDAITSDRPYQPARSWAAAAAEIQRHSGQQFDPQVVVAFAELRSRLEAIAAASPVAG